MFTQVVTFSIIVAIIGCIMYGRKLIRTEKVDAVFGNPERAKGGTHWIIVGSGVILLTWLYYSWDIAKSFAKALIFSVTILIRSFVSLFKSLLLVSKGIVLFVFITKVINISSS